VAEVDEESRAARYRQGEETNRARIASANLACQTSLAIDDESGCAEGRARQGVGGLGNDNVGSARVVGHLDPPLAESVRPTRRVADEGGRSRQLREGKYGVHSMPRTRLAYCLDRAGCGHHS
jgi:hypothetical protein